MQHRVRQIYLDELGEAAEQYIGIGIVQLVVESKKKTPEVARSLINKAQASSADVIIQQQIIELIETVVLYKFTLSESRGNRSHAGIERTEKDQSLSRSS